MVRFGIKGQNLGPFLVMKYIKNQSYHNMSIIKVLLPFLYFSMKRNKKDSYYFWHRKMTLKTNEIARTFSWLFS